MEEFSSYFLKKFSEVHVNKKDYVEIEFDRNKLKYQDIIYFFKLFEFFKCFLKSEDNNIFYPKTQEEAYSFFNSNVVTSFGIYLCEKPVCLQGFQKKLENHFC